MSLVFDIHSQALIDQAADEYLKNQFLMQAGACPSKSDDGEIKKAATITA
jgi:hypothetical protein